MLIYEINDKYVNVSNQLVANIEFLFILFRRFPQLFVALERLRLPQKY